MTDRNYIIVKNLATWADNEAEGINELAQAWLLAQPQVCSVITGATKVEHVLSMSTEPIGLLQRKSLKK